MGLSVNWLSIYYLITVAPKNDCNRTLRVRRKCNWYSDSVVEFREWHRSR